MDRLQDTISQHAKTISTGNQDPKKQNLQKEGCLIIYGNESTLRAPWVTQQKSLLFENEVHIVIEDLKQQLSNKPELQGVITYLENNQKRMLYGSYQKAGLFIGSGAIESAGKRLAQGRIKGAGMRWNVTDLNEVISLRCAFFDSSWQKYWDIQYLNAA